jgi:hypothetical protein
MHEAPYSTRSGTSNPLQVQARFDSPVFDFSFESLRPFSAHQAGRWGSTSPSSRKLCIKWSDAT